MLRSHDYFVTLHVSVSSAAAGVAHIYYDINFNDINFP